MDEILFENRFYKNREMLNEFLTKYTPVTSLWGRVFACAVAGYALYSLIWGGAVGTNRVIMIVVVVLAVVSQFKPRINASLDIARTKAMNGGKVPEHIVSFGDEIVVREGEQTLDLEYSQIRMGVRLRESYVLLLNSRSGILLKPDGFTMGTMEELLGFLRKICPGVKFDD